MALYTKRYGDGAGGSTLKKLSVVLGATGVHAFKQLSIMADKNNSGQVLLGDSTLTTAGVGCGRVIEAGDTFQIGPEEITSDLASVYLLGSDTNQKAYITLATGDKR